MWKNDDLYCNEYGGCAYVAGAVRALTMNLERSVYDVGVEFEALESDVFCVEKCDEEIIKLCVKDRLMKYCENDSLQYSSKDEIEAEIHDLIICEIKGSVNEAIAELYQDRNDVDKGKIKMAIDQYCKDVTFYLGKPQKIYCVDNSSLEVDGHLAQTYLYVLFQVIFIEFEKHVLMILQGSAE